jgi:hypothetical protein
MKDWNLAYDMAEKLVQSKSLSAKKREISEGDLYHYEQGEEIHFKIAGKKYSIGYVYITEDEDDWGQAECYEIKWVREGDREISEGEMVVAIESAKQVERDRMISELGIL